jgi:carbamoyl-phosphate synthase large subunit
MASGLKLNGPFNMQFLAKEGDIKVIETNVRAARSFPFVSKVVSLNLADAATDVMIGRDPIIQRKNEDDLPFVGVKAAMFSFKRLGGADPILGVEMASTGEVGCIAESFDEALLLALQATGCKRPKKGVFVSSGREHQKLKFLKSADTIRDLGLKMFATDGTAKYLEKHGYEVETLAWPGQNDGHRDCLEVIKSGEIDLVINIPKNSQREELELGAEIRRIAVQFGCTLFTNIEKTNAFIRALSRCQNFLDDHEVLPLPNYR